MTLYIFNIQMGIMKHAFDNTVIINNNDNKKLLNPLYIKIKNNIYKVSISNEIKDGHIGLNYEHRLQHNFSLTDKISIIKYNEVKVESYCNIMNLLIVPPKNLTKNIKSSKIIDIIYKNFTDQYFAEDQVVQFKIDDLLFKFSVISFSHISIIDGSEIKFQNAKLIKETKITIVLNDSNNIDIDDEQSLTDEIFNSKSKYPIWDFESLGVGGLDKEISNLFRRAFSSRLFPPSIIKKFNIKHTKGILLYGPPGTGKTLLARSIGKILGANEPKIVNGPSIFGKYVGESEKAIRDIFIDAETEYKNKGDNSSLHLIIFDEIDAICKKRGSYDSSGVRDNVVNQLLTKIQGHDELNNILVIGTTNRKDLIDEALLRQGRLELHIEVNLPDKFGRQQIFNIYMKNLFENKCIENDVSIDKLVKMTENYNGSEIESVVRNAISIAQNRNIEIEYGNIKVKSYDFKISQDDLEDAISEIIPNFGIKDDEMIHKKVYKIYNEEFQTLIDENINIFDKFKNNANNDIQLLSILLNGEKGSGKTELALHLAKICEFPFVKYLSSIKFIKLSITEKINRLIDIFEDAYKSPLSIIIIDDLERMIDYVRIGPSFSNQMLQTLMVLLNQKPNKNNKLIILSTCTNIKIFEDNELYNYFNYIYKVPLVSVKNGDDNIKMTIKEILMQKNIS